MNYTNGLARNEFLQHMYDEFPSVFNNAFSREMLENIVDYGTSNCAGSKNRLYYFLKDMIPEVELKDLIPFIDKELLTDEVLGLSEDALFRRVEFTPGYYEWNLYIDGDHFYTWGDGIIDDVPLDGTYKQLQGCVEATVDCMNLHLMEEEKVPLEKALIPVVQKKMTEVLGLHYGIDDDVRVVHSMNELREYIEANDWWVSECNFGGDAVGWEIGKHSPAGEDFFFSFEHNNDVQEAVKEIQRYAYDFDIDEHVELNLGVRGAPGVRELVDDAEAIQEMLDKLADGVNWCEQKSIGEVLADATARTAKDGFEQEPGKNQVDFEM